MDEPSESRLIFWKKFINIFKEPFYAINKKVLVTFTDFFCYVIFNLIEI